MIVSNSPACWSTFTLNTKLDDEQHSIRKKEAAKQ